MQAADIFMMAGSTPSVSDIFAAAVSPEMPAAPAGTGNFNVMLSDILFTGKTLDVSKGLLSDSAAGQADSVEGVKKPDLTLEVQSDQQMQQIGAAVVMAVVQPVLTPEVAEEPVQVITADPVAVVSKPEADMGRVDMMPEKQTASPRPASSEVAQTVEEAESAANSQPVQPVETAVKEARQEVVDPSARQAAQPVTAEALLEKVVQSRVEQPVQPVETAVKEARQEVVDPSARPAAQTVTAEAPLEKVVQSRVEQPVQPVETTVKEARQEVVDPSARPAVQADLKLQKAVAVPQQHIAAPKVESAEPAMQSIRSDAADRRDTAEPEVIREPAQKSEQVSITANSAGQSGKNSTAWWSYQQGNGDRNNQGQQPETVPQQKVEKTADFKPQQTEVTTQLSTTVQQRSQSAVAVEEAGTTSAASTDPSKSHLMAVAQVAGRTEVLEVEKDVARQERVAVPEQVTKQVADRIENHQFRQGRDQLSLTLNPESLGKIQMNFQMDQQNLRVEIVAENRTVRDALLQQTDLVKEALGRQNINLTGFDISTSGERASQQQYQHPQQQGRLYFDQNGQQGRGEGQYTGGGIDAEEYQPEDSYRYFDNQYQSTFAYQA